MNVQKMYNFTHNWHKRNHGLWQKYLTPGPWKYLEVGSHEGRSLIWMLSHIVVGPDAKAVVVDNWKNEEIEKRFDYNLEVSQYSYKVMKIKDYSYRALRRLQLGYFDIAYIDGWHKGVCPFEDAVLTYRLMKPEGIMIFDDYAREDYTVSKIDAFLDLWPVEVLHKQYQVIVKVKP